ncbi:DUF6112 family protein [Hymenobacter sp. IS2118]|uniref:DUF6112 family protein n=1 Tax=Hymenobacter sp. IS2118 TaxID=1505605 RepID=UPI0039772DD3
MKYFLLVLLCLYLLLVGFFWAIAHASGHNIPTETDRFFAVTALVNVGLIALSGAWVSRSNWTEKQRRKRLYID